MTTSEEPGTLSQLPTSTPRLHALQAKKLALETTLADLQAQHEALLETFANSTTTIPPIPKETALQVASARIKRHIVLLHTYNEIKDVGLGMMGMIAESRGDAQADVMKECGGAGEGLKGVLLWHLKHEAHSNRSSRDRGPAVQSYEYRQMR